MTEKIWHPYLCEPKFSFSWIVAKVMVDQVNNLTTIMIVYNHKWNLVQACSEIFKKDDVDGFDHVSG